MFFEALAQAYFIIGIVLFYLIGCVLAYGRLRAVNQQAEKWQILLGTSLSWGLLLVLKGEAAVTYFQFRDPERARRKRIEKEEADFLMRVRLYREARGTSEPKELPVAKPKELPGIPVKPPKFNFDNADREPYLWMK